MTYEIIALSGHAKDIAGRVFSRLTAIAPIGRNKHSSILWLCICDCGSEAVVSANALCKENTRSCGCFKLEHARKRSYIHGEYRAPENMVWAAMKARCDNPNNKSYKNYGGRGIKFSERWAYFENFIADMGKRPSSELTLERIDNDGDYCKENCEWATRTAQARNKRGNNMVTFEGVTKCLAGWSEHTGISRHTLSCRILRYGWSIERALTTQTRKWHRNTPL